MDTILFADIVTIVSLAAIMIESFLIWRACR